MARRARNRRPTRSSAEVEVETDEAAEVDAIVDAAAELEAVLVIAPGRAVTSLRGILGPGVVTTARDYAGGADTLASLVRAGTVTRR